MPKVMELISAVTDGFLSDEERRFLFRELAKLVLDPGGDAEVTVCDNDGNVLGFFDPVVHRMKVKGHAAPRASTAAEFLSGAQSAEEVFGSVLGTDRDTTPPR